MTKKINQNKPFITFKLDDDGKMIVQANNYPTIKGQCTGLEATKDFEDGLGKPGQRTFTSDQYQDQYQEQYQQESY